MIKPKRTNNFFRYFIYIAFIIILILMVLIGCIIFKIMAMELFLVESKVNQEVQGVLHNMLIEEYEKKPIFPQINNLSILYFDKPYTELDLQEFLTIYREVYNYSNETDCSYWAYVITEYVSYNDNYNSQYIGIPNHLFVILYNESAYIHIDGLNIEVYISEIEK